jgi:hemolysin activation/secretion protein
VSTLHYHVRMAEFRALDPRGNSRSASVQLLYPLVRATSRNLYLSAGLEHKRPYNTTTTGVTSDYDITNKLLRLEGNVFDGLFGPTAVSTASLDYVSGRLDLDGSPTRIPDAATTRTQGNFQLLRWRLGREQQLANGWSLFGAFSGQVADRNLDSAEKFYLGGPGGVRAYPVNEGGGTNGRMANMELRWLLPWAPGGWSTTLATFYDWGRVQVHKNAGFAGASRPHAYSLSGYGLSVHASGPGDVHLAATLARRAGRNPYPTATGQDQDGSLHRTRLWVSLSKLF